MLLPDQTYEQNNSHIESMWQSYHKVLLNRHSRTYHHQEQHRTCLNDDPNPALSYYVSSSNEAVHLQQRLQSLSTELVTLRNRLYVHNQDGSTNDLLYSNNNNNTNEMPAALPRKNVPSRFQSIANDLNSKQIDDLIHLNRPLSEDIVVKCLQARFSANHYYTNIGPILLCINPYQDLANSLTLSSAKDFNKNKQLNQIVLEAVRQQSETGYPQAIILSGASGSGKSYASMLLLRQLFEIAGGGCETDAFKHLSAAFTVLRSLGSAKTANNSESSRIGQFIEVQVSDGAVYRTKIHCYFLDQTRVIKQPFNEKNYHIFYQMLAGLTHDERQKLNLDGYSVANLKYLKNGDTKPISPDEATRFQAWRTSLGILGIPFMDVVRVLATVLLLGNIDFFDINNASDRVSSDNEKELNSVAALLGVSTKSLLKGLTSRTRTMKGCLIKSMCNSSVSNMTKDCLAKALYCRTVATIVRRSNSLKRLGSTLGTVSSDSNDSVHNHQPDLTSQHHASTISGPNVTNSNNKSMAVLSNAVRHVTDGFIGILDMFGFEDAKPSQLEHLCLNLCSETMQHFYNTHIFKSSLESCREEGIDCEIDVDYVDNVPCIDVISSLQTGLLSMLDVECSLRGTSESYVAKIRSQHRSNRKLFEPSSETLPLSRMFGIEHFAGKVVYDTQDFLSTNRDTIPDDLVVVFSKVNCSFSFATLLFTSELKALSAMNSIHDDNNYQKLARGISFRISPTSHTDLLNGTEPISTLTQDFHTRLDNLLRTLVHARPHFIRCIRSNNYEIATRFDSHVISSQLKSLEVLETLNLMSGGFPHRMRFKAFNLRYRLLAPFTKLFRTEDKALDDCKMILNYNCVLANPSENWAMGKRHVFLSEILRQQLEKNRLLVRDKSAVKVQATWRGYKARCQFNLRRIQSNKTSPALNPTKPRPQPISGTPTPPENLVLFPQQKIETKCDLKLVEKACKLFGLSSDNAPNVPASRSYTVHGNQKVTYPQKRLMKESFPEVCSYDDKNSDLILHKGEVVTVLGTSSRRGYLIVSFKNRKIHVPFQYLQLKKD